MRSPAYLLFVLLLLGCDPSAQIFEGFKSDLELTFHVCKEECAKVIQIDNGTTEYGFTGVRKSGGLYLNRLGDETYFPMDSVVFINIDSTFKMTFVNPDVDDSLDFKNKKDAHYWNKQNWEQKEWNTNFYFTIRETGFEKYKEPI